MENEIIFVNLRKLHSTKKEQDFYRVTYLMDREAVVDFVEEETFERLANKKPEYLKKYIGVFKINASNKSLQIKDFKEAK